MNASIRLLCAVVALPSLQLAAQGIDPPALEPGVRVRVSVPTLARHPLIGTVVSHGPDTLVLDVTGTRGLVTIPLTAVQTLEVGRGRRSHTLQGAGWGLLTGAVVGAVAGSSCDGDFMCPGPALGAAGTGVLFAIPGAIMGALARSERWESTPLSRMTVSPRSTSRGLGLVASVSF